MFQGDRMRRILLVDDNQATRTVCRQNLEDSYEIIEAADPKLAFPLALENKPDAILTQLSMSKISGFELCRTFVAFRLTKQTPLFVFGPEDLSNKASCLRMGVSEYCEKPVDFEHLRSALARVLLPRTPERPEHRRVPLGVILKLKGNDKDGRQIEIRASTVDMGAGGFLCTCNTHLTLGEPFEVFLCSGDEHYLGQAYAVRIDKADSQHPRLGFRFSYPPDGNKL
jgi:CheY-like chemotaxis protein